jgi:hypothetical protein
MTKHRSHYMTDAQKARWLLAEKQAGCKLPRSHQNCLQYLGVQRPGKTAKDKS